MTEIDPGLRKFIFDKIGYTPHSPEQAAIHDSASRFKILCCGRRYGKTTFGANEMTVALMSPNDPGYYWIVGPNYVQGEKEFRIIHNNISRKLGLASKIKRQYNVAQGQMRIEMPWGSVLEVKSADRKDSLLGEGLHGVIMAEAARHDQDTWEQYIRPALTDQRGWAIFTSTPRGFNWFWGLWMLGQTSTINAGYESWRLPSWENRYVFPNGRLDPEIVEAEQTTSAQFFAQEYAADFTTFVGKIYDEFDPKIHIKKIEYNPLWRNYWAFDYGFAAPFVCLDIMVDPSDNVYVWRDYQVRHMATYEHGHALKNRVNPPGFHVDAMFGDPHGADEAATLALVLGAVWGREVPWKQGIESVKRWMKVQPDGLPKLFIDESCTDLIRQLQLLHAPEIKDGINPKEGQHKHDDHGPDALRYFFSEYFILGAGTRLSDVYSADHLRSEGLTFFQQNSPFVRETTSFEF